MCVVYNHHYVIYNKDKTKVTQSIPSIVCKVVYVMYKMDYPDFEFQDETLKERLWETLKELKTRDIK